GLGERGRPGDPMLPGAGLTDLLDRPILGEDAPLILGLAGLPVILLPPPDYIAGAGVDLEVATAGVAEVAAPLDLRPVSALPRRDAPDPRLAVAPVVVA